MRHEGETPSGTCLDEAPSGDRLEEIPLSTTGSLLVDRKQGTVPKAKRLAPSKEPFDHKEYLSFQGKPVESKREYLKLQWLDIAYLTLTRAKTFTRSITKKDYGRLVQLLTAGGIAWDKVFPKVDTVQGNNLVLNLFNGLPKDKVVRVVGEVPLASEIPLSNNELPPTEGELPR
jgi:hypothetical protein